jgi:hypothetical protein
MNVVVRDICEAVLIASYLCGQFISNTDTPPPNTKWGKVYMLLELFAGVYNKAKMIGEPVPEKPKVEDLLHEIFLLRTQLRGQKVDDNVVPVPSSVFTNQDIAGQNKVSFTTNQENKS